MGVLLGGSSQNYEQEAAFGIWARSYSQNYGQRAANKSVSKGLLIEISLMSIHTTKGKSPPPTPATVKG